MIYIYIFTYNWSSFINRDISNKYTVAKKQIQYSLGDTWKSYYEWRIDKKNR